jgi:histidinol-phosphate aminotransferase
MLKVRESVASLPPYHGLIQRKPGTRLDLNENLHGCSSRVLARLQSLKAPDLALYPDRDLAEEKVAAFLGMDPECVFLSNGADEALHLLSHTLLAPGDEVLIATPTFSMYETFARACDANVVKVPYLAGFALPADGLLARISKKTRLIALTNPNNPTGTVAPRETLLAIADRAPQAAVLVDEAYFEFYGHTVLDEVPRRQNLFVARTFSKAYGLAGIRMGVLAGPAEVLAATRKIACPFNVNGIALACLDEALADQEHVRWYVSEVHKSHRLLAQALEESGIPYWRSEANFLLASFGARATAFVQGMQERGYLLRERTDPGCEHCVRIAVGTEEQTHELVRSIKAVLA